MIEKSPDDSPLLTKTKEIHTALDGSTYDAEEKKYTVYIKRHKDQPKLVTFGKGGHCVYFGDGHYLSGYERPDTYLAPSKWWAHSWAERLCPEQHEGVPYIDMRKAVETKEGYRMAISGPMINVDLEDDEIDECPEPSDMLAGGLAMESDKTFFSLLTLNEAQKRAGKKYGALDSVSIKVFMQLWKEAGAEVGIIKNGEFVPIK